MLTHFWSQPRVKKHCFRGCSVSHRPKLFLRDVNQKFLVLYAEIFSSFQKFVFKLKQNKFNFDIRL